MHHGTLKPWNDCTLSLYVGSYTRSQMICVDYAGKTLSAINGQREALPWKDFAKFSLLGQRIKRERPEKE